eukprot:CAMPEP_0175834870 /NCGR_PEP_ID=MMETSP0107_2-20121207/16288_1 /TAXON_ID=195067 ORGANISM="Goniomonas pacifica, Strain CCMP1869" /NCGR_SAMPLE_ID=MMETSP0107_2 /ASSEMBLY_ACC=CAM_ASM_000203 /LENGTH=124 /DNA_ID=CAMNT_0017148123 /DNA_START=19 /DNA_END=391 /DNA_ORIENTATION=-
MSQDTVYVAGLPRGVAESDIISAFSRCGSLAKDTKTGRVKVNIYRDKSTGQPKGDCTVKYTDPGFAADACKIMDGTTINGSTIHVEMVTPKEDEVAGATAAAAAAAGTADAAAVAAGTAATVAA